ncbi:MAG: MBL fold metallo-hydrolase [Burkholderiales bacterium]|nr:MBL fold metallo-hydrolase [Burkholderiales bacterium]
MRFASLGSGSAGNALLVQAGRTTVMVDCGFGLREATARCGRAGIEPESIGAIVVTHEHGDHVGGVARFARRFGIPVWLTFGTLAATSSRWDGCIVRNFDSHESFVIDDIQVQPFPVPHDAREPAQLVLSDGARRVGVLTDVGDTTPIIEAALAGCDALFLEANHCEAMLSGSSYPAALKARIAGRYGHLCNRMAAALLARLAHSRLQHVVAAHLSRENNRPELVREAFAQALATDPGDIVVASQDEGCDWRTLR